MIIINAENILCVSWGLCKKHLQQKSYHQVSSIILNHHSIIHFIISLTLTLLQCSFNNLIHTFNLALDFAVYFNWFA